jgi:hypothetical protein
MECTVPVEVRLATDHADLASLERTISGALAEAGRELWRQLTRQLEAALDVPTTCLACGGRLKANGAAPRRLVTLAGEVELPRRRYRCTGCGAEVVPLDQALGLEPRVQHSLGVRERALWLVTELSYQKTAEALSELRGIAISRTKLHEWVASEGRRIEASQAAGQAAIFEAGQQPLAEGRPETVWVSADGTFVNDRDTGTEFEVKVGLVFEDRQRIGRNRRRLAGRQLAGGTEDWQAFAERFVADCARLGVFEAKQVYFVSDGAPAIAKLRRRYFPEALELLDWHHLLQQLRFGLSHHPERLEQAVRLAAEGLPEAVQALLLAHAADVERGSAELAQRVREVAGYVAANERGIANYRIVPLASSGPTEKAVDVVVARRFKRRGMSWLRHGVGHLLRLRLLRLNGAWDAYWRERFEAAMRPWPSAA